MPKLSFSAQIDAWARKSEARLTAIFRESARRTASLAQSYVPVDTGFLRASIRGSTSEMPRIDPKANGSGGAQDGWGDVVLSIAGAEIGDTIYIGYTASYSRDVEYGTSPHVIEPKNVSALHWIEGGKGVFYKRVKHPGTPPAAYVGRAAAQWQQTVNGVIRDAKARIR